MTSSGQLAPPAVFQWRGERGRAARAGTPDARRHPGERHGEGFGSRLSWLRAGVLGANDGIVSVAGLVVGVAGVTTERGPLCTAGLAGLVRGRCRWPSARYVSVSGQRDSERAQLDTEKRELREDPEWELAELAALYEAKGLRPATARTVARELTEHDALAAHLDAGLSTIDPEDLTSPWQAAGASAFAFTLGAVLPVLAILLRHPLGVLSCVLGSCWSRSASLVGSAPFLAADLGPSPSPAL